MNIIPADYNNFTSHNYSRLKPSNIKKQEYLTPLKMRQVRLNDGFIKSEFYDLSGEKINEISCLKPSDKLKYTVIAHAGKSKLLTRGLLGLLKIFGTDCGGECTADLLRISLGGKLPANVYKLDLNEMDCEEKLYWENLINTTIDVVTLGYTSKDIDIYQFDFNSALSKKIKNNPKFKNKAREMLQHLQKEEHVAFEKKDSVDLRNSIHGMTVLEVKKERENLYKVKYADIYDFPQVYDEKRSSIKSYKGEHPDLTELGAILQRAGKSKPYAIAGTIYYTKEELFNNA